MITYINSSQRLMCSLSSCPIASLRYSEIEYKVELCIFDFTRATLYVGHCAYVHEL